MRDQHPLLGVAPSGRRQFIYRLAFFLTVAFAGMAYVLVATGVIPPTPTDEICSWVILAVLFVPFMALVDNPGETRTRVEKWSELGFCWLLVSGIAQTFWELPWFFLDLTGVVHGISAEDHVMWLWWVYGGADTRYIHSNPTIAGLEFMAGFSGPVELYGWWLYTNSKTIQQKITASWIALIIGTGLTYQTGVFFIAEWHVGWANIEQGATGFWLKFVGLNVPWIVAPMLGLPAAMYEIGHWYRVQGYDHAMRQVRAVQQSAAPSSKPAAYPSSKPGLSDSSQPAA